MSFSRKKTSLLTTKVKKGKVQFAGKALVMEIPELRTLQRRIAHRLNVEIL